MAYERDDREMDLEEQNMFEEDPAYGADTYFGERLEPTSDEEVAMEDEELAAEDVKPIETPAEETFGESIPEAEPMDEERAAETDDMEFEDAEDVDSRS